MKRIISLLLIVAMVISACSIPVFAADGTNIALGKTVIADTEWGSGFVLSNVNDGKLNTAWSAGSTRVYPKDKDGNGWIQIDLGGKFDITSMIAYPRSDVNQPAERTGWIYQVSETSDFENKVVIGTKRTAGLAGVGYEVELLEPVTARYVRVACPNYFVIAEIEVFGAPTLGISKGEYTDISQEGDLYDASQLAYTLGIMDGIGGGSFGVNNLMTRIEAAQVVAKLGNAGELSPVDTGFNDVKADNKLSGYVAWCENNLIISKDSEFRPNDFITGIDFALMLLRLNGWWEVVSKGKYPLMVATLAKQTNLLDSVDIVLENDINRGQALLMIKNVLLNESIKAVGVDSESGVVYEPTEDLLYLNSVFGYELKNGIVESNNISDLVEPKNGVEGVVTVGGIEYKDATGKMNAFLGERVWYLFDPDEDEIVGAWRNPDVGSTITIQCDQIEASSEKFVEYWVEGKDKVKKLNIEAPVYYIRNGVASGDYTPENLKRTNGRLVFIDNDDDNRYEVIKMYEPQVMLFQHFAESNGKLLISGKGLIPKGPTDENTEMIMGEKNLVFEDYQVLSVFLNGYATNYKEVAGDMLAYIYVSDDERYIEVELCSNSVAGKIEKITNNSFVIDGVEYERSQYYIDNEIVMDKVTVGSTVNFLVDMNGKIVWVMNLSLTVPSETLGVIYAMASPENFGNYRFRIYNQNNEHLWLTAANKITIDGKTCGTDEIRDMTYDYFVGKSVIYRLNSEGKVRFMDTENYNAATEPDSWLIKQDKWTLPAGSFRSSMGFYADDKKTMLMPFFDDYKVFNIPIDDRGAIIKEEEFQNRYSYQDMSSIVALNSTNGSSGTFTFYGLADDESPKLAMCLNAESTVSSISPVKSYISNDVMVAEYVGAYLDGDTVSSYIAGYNLKTGSSIELKIPYELEWVLDSYIIYTNQASETENIGIGFTGLNYVSGIKSTDILSYASPIDDIKPGDVLRYEATSNVASCLERIYAIKEGSPSHTFNGAYIYTGDNWSAAPYRAGFRALSGNIDMLNNGIVTLGDEKFKYAETGVKNFVLVDGDDIIVENIKILPVYAEENDRMLVISLSGQVSYIVVYK